PPRARASHSRGHVARPTRPRQPTGRRPRAPPLPPRDGIRAPRGAHLPCVAAAATTGPCETAGSWRLLPEWIEQQPHGAGERVPLRSFGDELRAAFRREAVIARALALVRQLPGRLDQALLFQPIERRVERAGFDLQQIFGGALNVLRDRVAVA